MRRHLPADRLRGDRTQRGGPGVRSPGHRARARLRPHGGFAHDDGGGRHPRSCHLGAGGQGRRVAAVGSGRGSGSEGGGRPHPRQRLGGAFPGGRPPLPPGRRAPGGDSAARAPGLAGVRRGDLPGFGLPDLRLGRGRGGGGSGPRHLGGEAAAGDRRVRGRPGASPQALRRPGRGRDAAGGGLGADGGGQAGGRALSERSPGYLHHPHHPRHARDPGPPAGEALAGRSLRRQGSR